MNWSKVVELERMLRIKPGQRVAVINGPAEYALIFPMGCGLDPDHAEAVAGFVTRRGDLGLVNSVYAAARGARLAWLSYPKPGRLGTDLSRDWLAQALRQYGVQAVVHVSIDSTWSALLLRPAEPDTLAADIDAAWPEVP